MSTPAANFNEREHVICKIARLVEERYIYWVGGGGEPLSELLGPIERWAKRKRNRLAFFHQARRSIPCRAIITQTAPAPRPNAGISVVADDPQSLFNSLSCTSSTFSGACVDRAARPAEDIRYKVIIRISLSGPRFRYMVPPWAAVSVLTHSVKGAKHVVDDARHRGSLHRHGGHELLVRQVLTVRRRAHATLAFTPGIRTIDGRRVSAGAS